MIEGYVVIRGVEDTTEIEQVVGGITGDSGTAFMDKWGGLSAEGIGG